MWRERADPGQRRALAHERKLQERYGIMKDEAERQVDTWMARVDDATKR